MDGYISSQESFSDIWNNDIRTDLFPDLNILQSEVTNQPLNEDQDTKSPNEDSTTTRSKLCNELKNDQLNLQLPNLVTTSKACERNNCIAADILPLSDYSGPYSFQAWFGERTTSAPKSANFTFSHTLNKIFAQSDKICPIQFKCANAPPPGCFIRAVPFYTKPEHATEKVTRCCHHRERNSELSVAGTHLVLAEMPTKNVCYNLTKGNRESVCVPYEDPLNCNDRFIIRYKFTCLSSCVSGINRRPLALAFYLEDGAGFKLGCLIVKLCICTCPGRDRSREEEKLKSKPIKQKRVSQSSSAATGSKQAKHDSEDNKTYTITVKGKKKYERLLAIKQAFDLADLVTSEQKEQYLINEKQCLL